MKKTYQKPELRVIELSMERDVLGMTVSDRETNNALSVDGFEWDEEDED